ncbi:MAG: DUF4214 domain-containing protein [Dokdonella sp.]
MLKAMLSRFSRKPSAAEFVETLTLASLSPEAFVRLAYLVVLGRQIDPLGLASWRAAISRNMFGHSDVVDQILRSEEYQRQFGIHVNQRLHASRLEWIKTLPKMDRLLDIGGSSPSRAEGALIEFGYPHRPSLLDILDLPPECQNWGTPSFNQAVPSEFDWGTVSYFHGCAEDIAKVQPLQDRMYDGVFLGQAVEHIYPEALPGILEWVRAHLAPSGRLIMDTPNRLLTKIQCPTWFIHPDHKLEYAPAQLEAVLVDNGFFVTKRVGITHLPTIAKTGVYDAREFHHAPLLHDDVDACYLFALEAMRDEMWNPVERSS